MNSFLRRMGMLALLVPALLLAGCGDQVTIDEDDESEEDDDEKKDKKKKKKTSDDDDDDDADEKADSKKKGGGDAIEGGSKEMRMLRDAFKKNHGSAMAEYAGREVSLEGFVSMKISENFRFNETGKAVQGTADILCRVDDKAFVDGLKVGDRIEITGTLTGTTYDIQGANLELAPCKAKKL